MGNYVLYLLMQAFIALIFAYFSGTLVFRERRPHMLLACIGFYLLMGSALLEVWGDRAGWETWAIGLNAAIVSISVAMLGASALMREAPEMDGQERITSMAFIFVGISSLLGAVLALMADSSDLVVDPEGVLDAQISGAFSHLGPVGWALGAPLFIGASLLAWMGARTTFAMGSIKGLWFLSAAILFILWPFHIEFAGLPMSPTFMMMGIVTSYFGFQLPEDEGQESADELEDLEAETEPGDRQDEGEGPSAWVGEAIAAQADETVEEDLEDG
ncbi:MAG: hypothetical protein GWN18_02910 [Thermoplasmata archaeon]|nr:hypothetical protein [Thermoplasmata archaeon]NIS11676.1 hypothetical protein [Thermoplasmata archaeon]NIS18894.1 hypothetical protein [Thermoplasmata archaeon]NIT76728.1 hypothetical protein [Thermoplasmata archaeon]NIU48051.1 hypothetical protein [Thermoplasmata archaeon]